MKFDDDGKLLLDKEEANEMNNMLDWLHDIIEKQKVWNKLNKQNSK